MEPNKMEEMRRRSLRMVGFLLVLTGIVFVVAAVVLFMLYSSDGDSTITVIAVALLLIGLSDLIIAMIIFRKYFGPPPTTPGSGINS